MAEFLIIFFSTIGGVIALYKFYQLYVLKPTYKKKSLIQKMESGKKMMIS
jgi:hypothetical protein